MDKTLNKTIDAIKHHVRILNHSSERMARSLDELEDDVKSLTERLAKIEATGWARLANIGVPIPRKIITIGGGAKNTTWKKIREKTIGIPIKTCPRPSAMGVALIALRAIRKT